MMNAPRCGNKDMVGHGEEARRRRKRYALQGNDDNWYEFIINFFYL